MQSTRSLSRRARGSYPLRRVLTPYLFILPFILFFCIFLIYPIADMVKLSFQDLQGFDEAEFVGWHNYRNLMGNANLMGAVRNTACYSLVIVAFMTTVPLCVAVLLNDKRLAGRNVLRTLYFMPTLTSVIVAGIFFRMFFGDSTDSVLNRFVSLIGLNPQKWLFSNAVNGGIAILTTFIWRQFGIYVIYYLSGLQTIPQDLYEAADIDGASAWQKFRSITIPALRPITMFVSTIALFGGLKMFGESYILWNRSVPPGDVGMTVMYYIYKKSFNTFEFGLAAATSCMFVVVVLILNYVYLKIMHIEND